jgi:hypothetical protein
MSFELVACVTAREFTFRESAALEQKAVFRNLRLDTDGSTRHTLAVGGCAASLVPIVANLDESDLAYLWDVIG